MNNFRNNIICPSCEYPFNSSDNKQCEGCGAILTFSQQETKLFNNKDEVILLDLPEPSKEKKTPHQTKYQPLKSNSVQKFSTNWKKNELLKPQNISGIAIILFSLYLWNGHLFATSKTKIKEGQELELIDSQGIKLVKSIKDVKSVPSGVFSYTNEGFFAALLREGLTKEILKEFPNFEIKYSPPTNQDPSYSVSVESLIGGDIDFLPLARPLTSTEYSKAKLQGIELQESAIARDGIVFYANSELSVDKITVAQLMAIFKGEINNWKQIGGKDLAITPVILSKENIESLGMTVGNAKINYVSSHTEAIRKIISTPGSIGFASTSLIRDQKLIKSLILGRVSRIDGSIKYINPFLSPGIPNSTEFENGNYPLVRSLSLVWINNNPRSQASGQAIANILLSLEGQALVNQAGFVPLRSQNK